MELDAIIEPTIGPYEVYEDEWFNYKAAFEAFITLRDDAETNKLARFGGELQEIENNLPIDPKYRNPKLGALAPIRVVNTVFSSGDANRGVQTAAFNLPNDERVIAEKGSKRVMLKNNQEAKFRMVLQPISKVALVGRGSGERVVRRVLHAHPDARADARPRAAQHHRRRPGDDGAAGDEGARRARSRKPRPTSRACSRCSSSSIAASWTKRFDQTMYTTYLASMFRSIRFGINEAHGRGVAMQLNYFLDNGGVTVAPDGTFTVNPQRIRQNVIDLTRDIMTMQAVGDYAAAKQMIEKLGVDPPAGAGDARQAEGRAGRHRAAVRDCEAAAVSGAP